MRRPNQHKASCVRDPGTIDTATPQKIPIRTLVQTYRNTHGLRPGCAVSFSGKSGCTYEVTRSYLHELERISERRFFVQNNSSDAQQFAREGCATLRKYAKLSEGDSQNGLAHHCQQPGYPQR